MPAVRAYMVLAVIAGYGETLSLPSRRRTTSTRFDGREIDAWVVSERTDTELQDAVAVRARGGRRARLRGRRPTPRSTSPTRSSDVAAPPPAAVAEAARPAGEAAAPAAATPQRPRRPSRTPSRRLLDRPRRRRAARPADALHGRARPAPHAGRGARLAGRRAGPLAGHAEPHAHLARPAVDGHAGPDDPGGGRLPALPAARARPLDQARQAGRPAARGQGHRARPHRGRRARRPARAPRAQLARPRPRRRRGARGGGQAGHRHAGDLRRSTPAAT